VRDPDAGDSLRLEVEMRPVDVAFIGVATAAGAPVAADEEALVRVTGLTDNTGYHWRARTLDQTGRVGDWSSYGANAEVDPDLLVAVPDAPAAPAGLGQFKSDAVTAIAVGALTDEAIGCSRARCSIRIPERQCGSRSKSAPWAWRSRTNQRRRACLGRAEASPP
jgi:hypothetical protein